MSVDKKARPQAKKIKKPKISPDKALAMTSTPAEEINPENIRDLRPAGYNPRVISVEQQEVLQRSMKEYGDIGGSSTRRPAAPSAGISASSSST